ncbi:MAG: ribosome-associated translation inhibitor RaiA [Fimbriimonadaceae bacterium]|nr:ribosome-associated translation inhibitor RaiA [Fimbriimonadaceae bacterium]
MKTHVHGKNLEIPIALEGDIESRLRQLADRYHFLHEATVQVDRQRGWYTAEVTLHVRHQILRAEERSNDLGSSVDHALDKLERQLHRHKGRLQHRGRASELRDAPPLTSFEPAEPDEEYTAPRVVRVKRIAIKPMSVDEAALQMELLGHDFYVFTNDESSDLNVVYRRKNGDIGLIQPE